MRLILLSILILCLAARSGADDTGPIRNADFESAALIDGWSINIYGAQPKINLDTTVKRHGRQSLHVSSQDATDTAFGQEITLKGYTFYQFTGWVRTQGLKPGTAPVYGTFQIQQPGGSGIVATGTNHSGTHDWERVSIYFRTPPDGRVRVAVFFAGFGRGTGEAWFDDLSIAEAHMSSDPVKVLKRPLVDAEISPLQYGQFIEYLCNMVPSMWAEKLYDGSFEGLSPYKFKYLTQTDFKEKPWYPCGATNRASFELDHDTKVSGDVSQRIRVEGSAPCTVGIAQDGIAVQPSAPCRFKVWLRREGGHGEVSVRLHEGSHTLATCHFSPDGEWRKYESTLQPSASSTGATLSIQFNGPGTLWLDNASLMPEDAVGGWRKDVVEALHALKPGVIRFGGSALDDSNLGDFEWRDTLGDVDHRKPFRAWGGLQPQGPGLEEIVQLCYAVNAEPLICVRTRTREPQDAADEVQYFNGAADTPMGAQRAKNGHPAPYGIRFWQVGNERSGTQYETILPPFCEAMKSADPAIKLMSSYPTEGVLRGAGQYIEYTCPHQYDCADLSGELQELNQTREMIKEFAPGRNIRVGVTEWNTTAGDAGPKRAGLWNLANALACSRYHNLLHRNCDLVEIANRSNLANSFCSGIIQTDTYRLYKTPTYYIQYLYSNLAGSRPLALESVSPTDLAPDISATVSADGSEITLFAVNDALTEEPRELDLSAFAHGPVDLQVWTLADRDKAGSPDVTNSFDDPERIVPVHTTFKADAARFTYRFPALSLTVLRLHGGER
jgi:alpha-N-arabinofuranosidase